MLIDDQYGFLESISVTLDKHLAYYLYDKPFEALQRINERQKPSSFINKCITYSDSCIINMDINVGDIYKEVLNPERFCAISVVVIDYAMPSMNGLEFCQRIQKSPVKKIMLTGEADERLAVEAFNNGIIDKFLRKGTIGLSENLNVAIRELQQDYFKDLSKDVFDGLVNDPSENYGCLLDPKFINFFNNFCRQNKVAEFYLLEGTGSFLLVDYNGCCNLLLVKTAKTLDEYYEAARDDGAPDSVLDELKTYRKLPYFGIGKNFWDVKGSEWKNYLHEVNNFEGKEVYYYSYFKVPTNYDLCDDKIFSYNRYLGKLIEKAVRD